MKKLVNFRFPLFIALSLVAGIVCAFTFRTQNHLVLWVFLSLFTISLLTYLIYGIINKNLAKHLIYILVFIFIFFIGSFTLNNQVSSFEKANLNDHYYTVEGRVSSYVGHSNGAYIVIEKADIKGNVTKRLDYKIGVTVYGAPKDKLDFGTRVRFFAMLNDNGVVYNSKPSVYGIADDIKYTASINASDLIVVSQEPNALHSVHTFLRDALKSGLDEQEFSVAYALLLGQDEYMDAETLSQFRSAGIAHIFAVSGLHIGFLAGVLTFLLKKTKLNGWVSLLITAFALIFYSGVCGFSSSSVRATIMSITLMLCNNLGLKYDGLTSVSLSAIIILLISPIQIFTAGFALSFTVVLGIIILTPLFMRIFKFMPYKISSLLSSVISAQLVSIPICIIFFNWVSTISVLFNLAILPVVGFLYVLTFLSTILGGIFSISFITLFPSNYLLKAVIYLFTLTDFSVFMVGGITLSIYILLYYFALLVVAGFFNLKRISKGVVAIFLILAFIAMAIIHNVSLSRQTRVYFIGSENTCMTVVLSKEQTLLIVNDFTIYSSVKRLESLLTDERVDTIDCIVIANIYTRTDIHSIVTKIHYVADFNKVYYYGEEQQNQERAIKLSFGNKVVENFLDTERLPISLANISFCNNGKAVELTSGDFSALAFSKLSSQPSKAHTNAQYDVIVAYNYQEAIFSLYKAKDKISYLVSQIYRNANSNGYLLYRI